MDHKQKNEYIKALQADQRKAVAVCNELLSYIASKKFRCGNELDGYVSISDVQSYVVRIKANL